MRQFAIIIVLLATCQAGCGDQAPASGQDAQVTDSAGIQLVRNDTRQTGTAPVVLTEVLRIGAVDGPPETSFHLINGVATDRAGNIYVIDQGTQAVRVFDRHGRYVRRFGRQGDGPGEFNVIGRLFVWNDSVHVQNLTGLYTGVIFDTMGALLMTYNGQGSNSLVFAEAGSERGWFVSESPQLEGRRNPGDVTRQSTSISRTSDPGSLARFHHSEGVRGTLFDSVAAYRGGRTVWTLAEEGHVGGSTPLFEPEASVAYDGRGFIYISNGYPYVIDVHSANGDLVRRIQGLHDPIVVDDDLIEDVMEHVRSSYEPVPGSTLDMVSIVEKRAGLPRVGFVPVTWHIRASTDGWLWVQRNDLEPDPATQGWWRGRRPLARNWDVFDPDGRFQYRVLLPERFVLHGVASDGAWGVQRDELDVEHVVHLQRSDPRAVDP